MSRLEVIARMRIRPGQLEGFKAQAAEMLRLAREKDTQILRYDWFLSEDGTACEVHEAYASQDGMIEHNVNVVEARDALFRDHAFDHRMSVYGDISPHLRDLFKKHAGGVGEFTFIEGIREEATV